MGCNCNKKRKTTGWGSGTARATTPTSETKVAEGPTKLRLLSGEEREYATRLEAHKAKIELGGGELVR